MHLQSWQFGIVKDGLCKYDLLKKANFITIGKVYLLSNICRILVSNRHIQTTAASIW